MDYLIADFWNFGWLVSSGKIIFQVYIVLYFETEMNNFVIWLVIMNNGKRFKVIITNILNLLLIIFWQSLSIRFKY